MKISELMTRDVTTCRLDHTLEVAANLFWTRDLGILPIVDSRERVVGLLTDRDACMAAFFRGRPLGEIPIAEAMSGSVVSCLAGDDVETVAEQMADAGVRRLPVITEDGRLQGIVGLTDLARAATSESSAAKQTRAAKALTRTLCAVGAPRSASPRADQPVELVPKAKAASSKAGARKSVTSKSPARKAEKSTGAKSKSRTKPRKS